LYTLTFKQQQLDSHADFIATAAHAHYSKSFTGKTSGATEATSSAATTLSAPTQQGAEAEAGLLQPGACWHGERWNALGTVDVRLLTCLRLLL
jgi:hypothetical protein